VAALDGRSQPLWVGSSLHRLPSDVETYMGATEIYFFQAFFVVRFECWRVWRQGVQECVRMAAAES